MICASSSAKWHLGLQHNLHDTTLYSLLNQSINLLLVDDTCSIPQVHITLLDSLNLLWSVFVYIYR